ncbi:hypothetical protein KIF53_13420 [Chromobacterium subtsugae]|uniref:DUF2489 domain-containing protein n=1 Tax=Chromobacterium subtsugae TaxID=251747 RepID=A0ABS7FEX2_9NEIS|nr:MULTISPECIES: hypothetical protein [Chromobacterium]KUM03503.1 hypothetical protein Cv017_19225 [Chromobacterium subtsugae]KZE87577.1 hypothetical protein AWB61_10340 [Chromobacterium sp. F49]MBW7567052.1 hypothetical protein [Chromobacterium subtsugae]MBW8288629.1 hypothetical protein [Chromobacterium subtsugae]WSE90144.1 hypothetical protein U6115_14740 [Chromobacterium subtsugae]
MNLNHEVASLQRIAQYTSANITRASAAGRSFIEITRASPAALELVADIYSVRFEREERIDTSVPFDTAAWEQEMLVMSAPANRPAWRQLYRMARQMINGKRQLLQAEAAC